MRISVGSRNIVKIRGVERAFKRFFGEDVYIESVEIRGLPRQPVGLNEVINLACYRAEEAMREKPSNYSVGVEAGFLVLNEQGSVVNIQIACLLNEAKERFLGFSQAFEISRRLYEETLASGELDEAIERLTGIRDIGSGVGLVGLATRGLIIREDLVYNAVAMAITSMLIKKLFS